MSDPLTPIFALSPHIRYVALARDGQLALRERAGLSGSSSAESDRYEELLVNPTIVTLVGQRGRIDCGGLEYIVIRYGNFFQIVRPIPGGHLSVAVEPHGDPLAIAAAVERAVPDLIAAAGPGGSPRTP